jgi:hypothetical protein
MRRERGANEITRRLPPYMCRKPRPFDLVKESRNVGHDGRAALLGAHRLEDRIYLILGPAVLDRCVLSLDEAWIRRATPPRLRKSAVFCMSG